MLKMFFLIKKYHQIYIKKLFQLKIILFEKK